jgi:hypothetical protein
VRGTVALTALPGDKGIKPKFGVGFAGKFPLQGKAIPIQLGRHVPAMVGGVIGFGHRGAGAVGSILVPVGEQRPQHIEHRPALMVVIIALHGQLKIVRTAVGKGGKQHASAI